MWERDRRAAKLPQRPVTELVAGSAQTGAAAAARRMLPIAAKGTRLSCLKRIGCRIAPTKGRLGLGLASSIAGLQFELTYIEKSRDSVSFPRREFAGGGQQIVGNYVSGTSKMNATQI